MWRIGLPKKEDFRPSGVETTSPGSSSTVLRCRGQPAIRSSHRRRRLYTRWSSGPSNWPHGEIVSGLLGHQRMTDRWDLDAPLLVPPKRQLSCLSHLRRLIHARPRRLTRGLQLCTVGCVRPFGGCSTLPCSHPNDPATRSVRCIETTRNAKLPQRAPANDQARSERNSRENRREPNSALRVLNGVLNSPSLQRAGASPGVVVSCLSGWPRRA